MVSGMTGTLISGAAALTMAASMLLGAPAAQASPSQNIESGSTTPLGSVTIAVDRVHTYEVSGCLTVSFVVQARTVSADIRWSGTVSARREGTISTNSSYVFGRGTANETGEFLLCPFSDSAGPWLITSEIELSDYSRDLEYTATPTATFELRKANTRLSISRVKKASFWIEVQGRMTSNSPRLGRVGAPGSITIEARKGRRWVEVGSGSANDRGQYKVNVYEDLRKGTQLRAVHRATNSTLGSRSRVVRF
jgi:hypothetical protein